MICIHSPLLGTPLANPKRVVNSKFSLMIKEKILIHLLNILVNSRYGFQQDNYKGVDLNLVDLNKLILIGNCIDTKKKEKNKLLLKTYKIIKRCN